MIQLSLTRKLAFIDYAIKELEKGHDAEDMGICVIYAKSKFAFKYDTWSSLGVRFPELRFEIDKVLKRQSERAVLTYNNKNAFTARIKLLKRVKKQLLSL